MSSDTSASTSSSASSSSSSPPRSSSLSSSSSPSPSSSTTSSPSLRPLSSPFTSPSSISPPPIIRVALVGGPSGGKTTATASLTELFQSMGWRVLRVPEAANILLSCSGGINFPALTNEQAYQFQLSLVKLMLQLEESFLSVAKNSTTDPCIILYDRGTMDCRSFMSEADWARLCSEIHSSTIELRDLRYDCVIHLVTAAKGAEQFYTIEGHASRSESPLFARESDERIMKCWIGHPDLHIVDNSTDFNTKISRVKNIILKYIGLPVPVVEKEGGNNLLKRKFLLKKSFNSECFPLDLNTQKSNVEHHYLIAKAANNMITNATTSPTNSSSNASTSSSSPSPSPSSPPLTSFQSRIRKRTVNGQFPSYTLTQRFAALKGQKIEIKRTLTRREYNDLLLLRDDTKYKISKVRYTFLWGNQNYQIDEFVQPNTGLMLLEFYSNQNKKDTASDTDNNDIPEWLLGHIDSEVTNNMKYSMADLAQSNGTVVVYGIGTGGSEENTPKLIGEKGAKMGMGVAGQEHFALPSAVSENGQNGAGRSMAHGHSSHSHHHQNSNSENGTSLFGKK